MRRPITGPAKQSLELVIASEAKQSIAQQKERVDCFVASLLAMTAKSTDSSSPRTRGSSTPRLIDSIIGVSEYWIARLRGR
jgi:hypothetical protein